jgi:hypothetical protein
MWVDLVIALWRPHSPDIGFPMSACFRVFSACPIEEVRLRSRELLGLDLDPVFGRKVVRCFAAIEQGRHRHANSHELRWLILRVRLSLFARDR